MGAAAFIVGDAFESGVLADGTYTEESPGYIAPAEFITELGTHYQDIVDHYGLTLSNYKFLITQAGTYPGGVDYYIYPTELNISVSGSVINADGGRTVLGYRKYIGLTTGYIEVNGNGWLTTTTKTNIGTQVAAYQRIRNIRHKDSAFVRDKAVRWKDSTAWGRVNI